MLAGQVMVGFWLSSTLTVNVQLVALFAVSWAVQVTVVNPFGKTEPDAGEQLEVTPEQLSVAVGAA